jgi:hypothetical protein
MKKKLLNSSFLFVFFSLFLLCNQSALASVKKNVGGLESEPPQWTEFSNLLNNSGFETAGTWETGYGCSFSTERAYSGGRSLKCSGSSFSSNHQPHVQINAIGQRIRGWVFPATGATGTISILIFNTSRQTTASGGVNLAVGKDIIANRWNEFSIQEGSYLNSGLKNDNFQFRIVARSGVSGNFYFDNLEFMPLVPLVRTWVKYPNFRGYIWSDKSQIISGAVEASAPEGENISNYKAVLSYYKVMGGASDQLVGGEEILSFNQGKADFYFDASSFLNDDEILIKTSLKRKSDNQEIANFPDWRVVKKSASARNSFSVYIDSDNKLVKNGAKRFLYGVYDRFSGARCSGCLWNNKNSYINNINGFNNLKTIENYEDTRANAVIYFSPMSGGNPGFNTSTSDPDNPATRSAALDNITPWADVLNDYGAGHFHIVHEYHTGKAYKPFWTVGLTESQMWKVISTYIDSPGFWGYYTSDEPDLNDQRTTQKEGWDIYNALRENDNDHPAFAVMYGSGAGSRWRNLVDMIGIDPYPIGRGVLPTDYLYGDTTGPFMGQVKQYVKELNDQVYGSRPVIAVLQLFKQTSQSHFPTKDEMRQMAWRSIIEGADGILWWGFVSSSGMEGAWYGAGNHDAYFDYQTVSSEIMDLEPVILTENKSNFVVCNNSNIDYIVKERGESLYVIASNNKDNNENGAVFSISGAKQAAETIALYEQRSLNLRNNSFSDNFSPYGVHVYKISLQAPGDNPPSSGSDGGGSNSTSTPNFNSTSTCASWTYDGWGACVNSLQSRNIISASPANCSGGNPELTRSCSTNSQNNNSTSTDNAINNNNPNSGNLNLAGNDYDKDGLRNDLENALGTNPRLADSDRDGYSDRTELINGYNPLGKGRLLFDEKFTRKHLGKIFLQIEQRGQAWYINPRTLRRRYLGQPADAYKLMRQVGLGARHSFITKTKKYPERLLGRILIDVEDRGKAYYISPRDRQAHYLGSAANALAIIKKTAYGVRTRDLNKIKVEVE